MRLSRSVAKAISFRLLVVVVDTPLLIWLIGTATGGVLATFGRHLIETIVYWAHERLWRQLPFGTVHYRANARRSLIKTVTYRLLTITADTVIFSVWLDVTAAIGGALFIALINSALYYLHERMWAKLPLFQHTCG